MDVREINSFIEKKSRVVKESDCSLVAETSDWIYKYKEIDVHNPRTFFKVIVARGFAKEYQDLGIDWDISFVENNGRKFQVERRQKLEVLNPEDISIEEAFKASSVVRKKVEKRLEFPRLFAQIHSSEGFKSFSKLVLGLSHRNEISDFAVFGNQVIVLGESSMFLALLDEDGEWQTTPSQRVVPVSLKSGEFWFADYNLFARKNALGSCLTDCLKWWLFPKNVGDIGQLRDQLYKELENMFTSNLKVLTTKEPRESKTRSDFGNVFEEMKKLGLLEDDFSAETITFEE